jgi:uncharacterized protein (TIGR02594 family)
MAKAKEPSWLRHGRTLVGTREAAGDANSATILGWAKRLGAKVVGIIYNADSVPWCGLFIAICMEHAGITPVSLAVRARSWSEWGSRLRLERLAPGAVLVFDRPGGGHVAFYIGEDATHFTCSAVTKPTGSASCGWSAAAASLRAGRPGNPW